MLLASTHVDPAAVELTDPLGITMYLGLAFVLYAIRETNYVSNKWIPAIGIVLGLLFAWLQFGYFNSETLIAGLRLGILGVGSVATIKYLLSNIGREENRKDENI